MKHSAVAWSFGKSSNSFYNTNKSPGPGAYNSSIISSYKSKPPNWKLGTAKRSNSFKSSVPGPGNYDPYKSIGYNAPRYTMRPKTGTNFNERNKSQPGPGAYNPDVIKKQDYKYSMRTRPQTANSLMNNPGPGSYNLRKLDSDLLKKHAVLFGKESKHKDPNFTYIKNPGPGSYNYENPFATNSQPKYSFGKELRANNKSNNPRAKTPGPGTYESKKVIGNEGPKITMSFNRPNTGFKNSNPGPGTYMPNLTYKEKSPEYRIGTSKREIVDKETKLKPGPGTYYPDKVNYVKNKSPGWIMGKEERGNQMNPGKYNPGPGVYNYKTTVGEGPKYSLTGKTFYNPNRLGNPGPGTYQNENVSIVYKKEPTWRIGTSSREDVIKKVKREGIPGPGNYSIYSRAVEGRKYGFGTEKRNANDKGFTPGPGQYHIPCSIVDVPRYQTYSSGFKDEFRFI